MLKHSLFTFTAIGGPRIWCQRGMCEVEAGCRDVPMG